MALDITKLVKERIGTVILIGEDADDASAFQAAKVKAGKLVVEAAVSISPPAGGFATETEQEAQTTVLDDIEAKIPDLGPALAAASIPVVLATDHPEVPTKTADGSDVALGTTTDAAWDGSSAASLVSVAKAESLSLDTIDSAIGDLQTTLDTNGVFVRGAITPGSAASGDPVLMGGANDAGNVAFLPVVQQDNGKWGVAITGSDFEGQPDDFRPVSVGGRSGDNLKRTLALDTAGHMIPSGADAVGDAPTVPPILIGGKGQMGGKILELLIDDGNYGVMASVVNIPTVQGPVPPGGILAGYSPVLSGGHSTDDGTAQVVELDPVGRVRVAGPDAVGSVSTVRPVSMGTIDGGGLRREVLSTAAGAIRNAPALAVATNYGSVIAAADTAQDAIADNPARVALHFSNDSDTDMWINFGADAAEAAPSFRVPAGTPWPGLGNSVVPAGQLSVICSADTKAYTAVEFV